MKLRFKLFILLLSIFSTTAFAQKQFVVKAPLGKLQINVTINKNDIEYSILHGDDVMIEKSPISMKLANGTGFGINPQFSKSTTKSVNQTINAVNYKRDVITDNYNELTLQFKGGYNLIFRAYDDGAAYRFVSTSKTPIIVENEQATFNFPSNRKAYIPYAKGRNKDTFEGQFYSAFQNTYSYISLSEWDKKRIAFAPILVEGAHDKKVCITEADLLDYPGMYLHNADNSNSLKGVFAPYPKKIVQAVRGLKGEVRERESYIAKTKGATSFPWRVIVVSEKDHELANSDMVYKLATPAQFTDVSWIKPGKVAWDWWNDWNIHNVDFRAGINNETYKYYIDFASKYGIEYVILDEGWSVENEADLFQVVPEIDLKELIRYANSKGVDIILWAGYYAFDKDIEAICKHYSAMGVKGFKLDFMDRDDQPMVDFHHRAAQIGAKHNMLISFHGTYKPTGLQRTYPNVINFEGVHGLEEMKWALDSVDQVTYDVTIPFIRMVAGPFDYTQGAMKNANRKNFRAVYTEPMSQGTRCRQLAEYVIFDSPMTMLCDNPSNYMQEGEYTQFLTSIPTIWDQTIPLNGKVAEYVSMARQKDGVWYVGALTNWDSRDIELDLSFLGEGKYKAEIYRDGINADRAARDYIREVIDIQSNTKLKIPMASGGGYIAKITKY